MDEFRGHAATLADHMMAEYRTDFVHGALRPKIVDCHMKPHTINEFESMFQHQ